MPRLRDIEVVYEVLCIGYGSVCVVVFESELSALTV
jgi:hypothetical protein